MAGKLVHFELPAQDAARARAFWSGLFGWRFQDSGMPDVDYQMVRTGKDQGGAVYPADASVRGPIVYFDTDDIDASVARARELGGHAENKEPIPHVGWFARARDTEGNEFSFFQSDESVTMPS
jgi:predicted enzyme related to lactoylglutathione lyase